MVCGSPHHSESNGGAERVNQTVECKIGVWFKDNNSTAWSVGCKVIQWRHNTHYHEGIQKTPYEVTFGQPPRVGISNLPITSEVLKTLATEADLNKIVVIKSKPTQRAAGTSASESTVSIPKIPPISPPIGGNKDDEEGSNASSEEEETSIPKEAIFTEMRVCVIVIGILHVTKYLKLGM
jgi:hypothetical protein